MALQTSFETVRADELVALAERKRADGYRFVQMLCVNTDAGIDALYSFMKDGTLENYTVCAIDAERESVPSITGSYLSAFPFENEAHDLFGLKVTDIAIDFAGNFYQVAMDKPMTVISPAQKAAREKAARIAAAKAAKAAKKEAPSADDIEAKLAGMDPEKAAKVRAAMQAKAAKEKAAADAAARDALEKKLAGMDPEKAAKVRAAMEAKASRDAAKRKGGE